jgi:hypothetical protein
MFQTQTEARQFFIERLIRQANFERVPLSDDEREMLLWSESAPDSVSDPELATRLAASISDADYESKMAGLLSRSFAEDVSGDTSAQQLWQDARAVLKKGDHYILIVIDKAVGPQVGKWWKFW